MNLTDLIYWAKSQMKLVVLSDVPFSHSDKVLSELNSGISFWQIERVKILSWSCPSIAVIVSPDERCPIANVSDWQMSMVVNSYPPYFSELNIVFPEDNSRNLARFVVSAWPKGKIPSSLTSIMISINSIDHGNKATSMRKDKMISIIYSDSPVS